MPLKGHSIVTEVHILSFVFFIFGICFGSFLNVCIVRWPHERSVVKPRSSCVACKTPIAWYDNIPLVSYVLLGGKCRHCQAKFSFLYFFIELLTGITFVLFYLYYGLDIVLVPYLFMVCCFIIATFVDFGHRIIPDEVSLGGLAFGVGFSLLIPQLHTMDDATLAMGRIFMRILIGAIIVIHALDYAWHKFRESRGMDVGEEEEGFDLWTAVVVFSALGFDLLIDYGRGFLEASALSAWLPNLLSLDAAVIGFMVGGGSIYAMGLLGDFLFRKESMGGGDVKLLAMAGAFLGWKASILAFFIAPFFGAVFGVVEKIRTKDTTIAYGPFLVAGCLIALFWQNQIIEYIMGLYGFR